MCFEERDEGEGFWERELKRDSGQRGCRQEIPEKEKRRDILRLSRSMQPLSCRAS